MLTYAGAEQTQRNLEKRRCGAVRGAGARGVRGFGLFSAATHYVQRHRQREPEAARRPSTTWRHCAARRARLEWVHGAVLQ